MAILALLAWAPLAFGCVEPWSAGILEALAFGSALLAARKTTFDRISLAADPVAPILLSICAVAVLFVLQSAHPIAITGLPVARPFALSVYYTRKLALLWFAYAAVLWAAARSLSSRLSARRFAWSFFLLGAVVGVVGILQFYAADNRLIYGLRPVSSIYFPFGPYYNADHAACMMAMSFLLGAGLLMSALARIRKAERMIAAADDVAQACLIFLLMMIILRGILMTTSRGAMLGLAAGGVGGCAFAVLRPSRSGGRFSETAAACAALLLLSLLAFHWFSTVRTLRVPLLDPSDSSSRVRLSIYRSALRMFLDSPYFGFGGRGFYVAYRAYQEPSVKGLVEFAHSDPLEILLSSGLIGLAAMSAGLVLTMRSLLLRWLRSESSEAVCLAGGGLAAVTAFLVHGLVDFNFQIPGNAALFFCLIGWLASPGLWASGGLREPAAILAPTARSVGRIASGVCYVLLACIALFPVGASAYSWKADAAPLPGRLALYDTALSFDRNPAILYRRAYSYWSLSQQDPTRKEMWLRKALADSAEALQNAPLEPTCRQFYGTILWYLGRPADAQPYLLRPS